MQAMFCWGSLTCVHGAGGLGWRRRSLGSGPDAGRGRPGRASALCSSFPLCAAHSHISKQQQKKPDERSPMRALALAGSSLPRALGSWRGGSGADLGRASPESLPQQRVALCHRHHCPRWASSQLSHGLASLRAGDYGDDVTEHSGVLRGYLLQFPPHPAAAAPAALLPHPGPCCGGLRTEEGLLPVEATTSQSG